MKRIVEEVSGEGLESLLGKYVEIWCMNYIYSGKLSGVNADDILLTDACVVYDTGAFTEDSWADAQALKTPRYIRCAAIESYSERSW